MVGASVSEEGTGSSSTLSRKRQLDGVNTEDKRLSETLLDLNILDCPICFEALTIPIFQCDNGHLACSSCCPKLKDKCPSCAFPIGHSRCRAMESVLGSIMVPCPNAKFGCTKSFSYGKESSTHVNECNTPEYKAIKMAGGEPTAEAPDLVAQPKKPLKQRVYRKKNTASKKPCPSETGVTGDGVNFTDEEFEEFKKFFVEQRELLFKRITEAVNQRNLPTTLDSKS